MTFLEAIILGIVQGLTEFIPISSSGHLVLARKLFDIEPPGIEFDVVLHIGTLLSVLIYFAKDLIGLMKNTSENRKIIKDLIIATIPVVIIGFGVSGVINKLEAFPYIVGISLFATGLAFVVVESVFSKKEKREGSLKKELHHVTFLDALIIGLAQSLALLPGVSRSGSTIIAGLTRGISREAATRFSFLLSIPAIAGAGLLTTINLFQETGSIPFTPEATAGLVASFAAGLVAISFLLRFVRKNSLAVFGYYMVVVGVIYFISVL